MRIPVSSVTLPVLLLSLSLPHFIPPASAKETVRYSGSLTLLATLFEASGLLTAFEKETGIGFDHPREQSPSTRGIADLVEGKADIAGVSRTLRAEEKVKGLVATVIAYDALGIFVNRENPVPGFSRAQLKAVLTGKIRDWKELGWKEGPITVAFDFLAEQTATQEVVKELITEGADYDRSILNQMKISGDRVAEVARNPLTMTVVALGWYRTAPAEIREKVKLLPLDGAMPGDQAVNSGEYPLSRPCLLVTLGFPKGPAKSFIDFVISPRGQAYVEKSFTPLLRK